MATSDYYNVYRWSGRNVLATCRWSERTADKTYLASVRSATVASPRLKAAADRTRGAWPQSMRALAEKMSMIVKGRE